MANIQIIQGDFEKKLKLQFAPGIRAGFPSPAEDYNHDTLDFNRDLIRNPEATFYGKVEGDSMIEAGVIVMGIGPNSPIQQDLFDTNAEQFEKMKRLDAVIDRINKVKGTETIVLGSQQYTQKDGKGKANVFARSAQRDACQSKNAIKHDFKSKNPTTRWSDIIRLK